MAPHARIRAERLPACGDACWTANAPGASAEATQREKDVHQRKCVTENLSPLHGREINSSGQQNSEKYSMSNTGLSRGIRLQTLNVIDKECARLAKLTASFGSNDSYYPEIERILALLEMTSLIVHSYENNSDERHTTLLAELSARANRRWCRLFSHSADQNKNAHSRVGRFGRQWHAVMHRCP